MKYKLEIHKDATSKLDSEFKLNKQNTQLYK